MNEERLDELLDLALDAGKLPVDATEEERAELAPLLASAIALDATAEIVASEAAANMPIARARFERFIAAETSVAPVEPVAQAPAAGWLGRLLGGSRRPLAATGVAAAVVLLVVVGVLGSDLILSDTSSAYALEVDPGDYVQIDGVVTEVTEGEDGPRVRLESAGGFIEIELSSDTSLLHDNVAMDMNDVHVGQQLAVTGLVNPERRVRAAILSVQQEGRDAPGKVPVDEPKNGDDVFIGDVVFVRLDETRQHGKVTLKLPDGRVVRFDLKGEELADFISREGYGPGANVTLNQTSDGDNKRFSFAPPLERDDPCERPAGLLDRQGQETICGILLSHEGLTMTLRTFDGVQDRVQTIRMLPGAHVEAHNLSGLTRQEILRTDAAIGHGIQVTGHWDGDQFVVGLVIVGPEPNLPPPPPPSDRR